MPDQEQRAQRDFPSDQRAQRDLTGSNEHLSFNGWTLRRNG
jgi:hypothetical protein